LELAAGRKIQAGLRLKSIIKRHQRQNRNNETGTSHI
jgi:hypothetical protein